MAPGGPPPVGNLTRRVTLDGYDFLAPAKFEGKLKGETAIVTGSGRGIGKTVALCLCRAGAKVAFFARNKQEVEESAKEGRKLGVETIGIVGDVCKKEDLQRLADETEARLGPVTFCVNAAGYNTFEPFLLSESDEWWKLVEVNLRGPVDLIRILLPGMIKRGKGRFLSISSIAAAFNLPYTIHYACAKSSILRMTACMQKEMAIKDPSTPIRLWSCHPGEVHTSLHDQPLRPRVQKEAPEVQQLLDRLHTSLPGYTADLCGMTAVFLATGGGDELGGRFIDCTRDLGEMLARVDEIKEKNLYDLTMGFLE